MAFCMNCGKQLAENESFCMNCGAPAGVQPNAAPQPTAAPMPIVDEGALLNTLSQRLNTGAIIWIVIGALQIFAGLFWNWWLAIVGVLNIVSSIKDMSYAKKIFADQKDIVKNFESVVEPIITLVYNLVIGGVVGVAGSIYYFVAIRGYVMENKDAFLAMEQRQI